MILVATLEVATGFEETSYQIQSCNIFAAARGGFDNSSCGHDLSHSCATVQQAVWNAQEGDTVCLWAGYTSAGDDDDRPTFSCPNDGKGTLVDKSLHIRGLADASGPEIVIDCQNKGSAFWLQKTAANVELHGLTVQNARAPNGGGIFSESCPVSTYRFVQVYEQHGRRHGMWGYPHLRTGPPSHTQQQPIRQQPSCSWRRGCSLHYSIQFERCQVSRDKKYVLQ